MGNALLVIDLQPEFAGNSGQYKKVLDFIDKNRSNYLYVIATKFCNGNKNFPRYLNWEFKASNSGIYSDTGLDFVADKIITKQGYGLSNYRSSLPMHFNYDIVGCETDSCVLTTAMDMFSLRYNFRVLSDYCYSNRKEMHDIAVNFMKRNLGTCIV